MSTVNKSVTTDFGGNFVAWIFDEECAADATIMGKFSHINQNSDSVDIVFTSALNGSETTALNALISAHNPQIIDNIPSGTQEVPILIITESTSIGNADPGTGRLYRKTGDDGLWWKESNGSEVDVTETGETNTASNVGSGDGFFKQKNGTDLEFKTLIASSNRFSITSNTNDISVDVVEANIVHDNLSGFVANEHIDHSTVSINAGIGLTGGGDLTTSRTIDIDINGLTQESNPDNASDFLAIYDTSAATHRKVLIEDIFPETYQFDVYDNTGGQSFTGAPIILNLDTVRINSGEFTLANSEVTINVTATLFFIFRVSTDADSNSRSVSWCWLERNTGSGFIPVDGTYGYMYNRQDSQGENTATVHAIVNVNSGDIFRIAVGRESGGATISTKVDASGLTIFSPGAQGSPGVPGSGSTIIVQDEGTPLPNTPHSVLNFIGAGVVATDGGSGVANISITGGGGGSGETNTASNVGAGTGWFKQKTGVDLEFKSLILGSNKLSVANNTNDLTLDVVEANIVHDNLSGFVANEHINHSSVSITAGEGLSGGGDLTTTRTIDLDINSLTTDTTPNPSADFLAIYDTSGTNHKKVLLSNIQRVQVQDEGVGVANTPHTTLNFVGPNVTVTDAGAGVATVTLTDAGEANTASNVGTGAGIFKQKTVTNLEFKSLIAANNRLAITNNTNDLTLNVVETNINHNNLLNYVANRHIDHSAVSILAGTGLSGGGNITANRTLNLDINSLTTENTIDQVNDTIAFYDANVTGIRKTAIQNIQRIRVQDEGINVANTPHTTLNFVGGGITATNAGGGVATITVPDPAGVVTLQNAYDNSSNPEIVLDGTRGAVTIRDNSTPIGSPLIEIQNNAGSLTYLAADVTGAQIDGGVTITEKSSNPVTPATGKGVVWVRNDANQKVMFSDDTGANFVLNPLTTKGDIFSHSATEELRHPVGTDGQFLIADSSTPTGLNWALAGQTIGDVQGVSITDLTGVSESSTTFVDVPGMTLTTNNEGTADYLVIFSSYFTASNSGGSRELHTIIDVGGVDQSATERIQRPSSSDNQLWSTQHFIMSVPNGTVIKVQWKRSGPSVTYTMYNRELIIIGLN